MTTWERNDAKGVLGAFSSDTTRKLHILGHNGDAFAVDGTQVRVLYE